VPDVLTVRFYNVRFGDAILVTVPDRDPDTGVVSTRRILIDVGNAPLVASKEGGDDSVFRAAIDDILAQLNGAPLDLYVVTHEHLDHVQGLPYAAWKLYPDLKDRLQVRHVWMTASAAPDYYDRHPEAKKQKIAFEAMHTATASHLSTLEAVPGRDSLLRVLLNNDPSKTGACMDFLRSLNPAGTTFVYRGAPVAGTHPFREAKLTVWAPEEDTAEYYGKFQPLAAAPGSAASGGAAPVRSPVPPPGVDVGAFLNLVAARRAGIADNVLAIDQAANNTSVVFLLEWRGWRLLFAGDAETRSWKTMAREQVLAPVHFLKVSHHGSHNGTPDGAPFDAVLPDQPSDDRRRSAAISTWVDTYGGIPHEPTNGRLRARCTLHSTLDDRAAPHYEIEFPSPT
jgi:beta-lactamase superfamily II metal-dependent hydrolase